MITVILLIILMSSFFRISSELVHQLVHNFGDHTKALQVYKDILSADPNNLKVKQFKKINTLAHFH